MKNLLGFASLCAAQVHFDLYKPNASTSVRRSIDLPIENQQTHFRSKIYIGTPQQEVEVLMDTGSSDFWVLDEGAQCVSTEQCPDRAKFDEQKSESYVTNEKLGVFSVTYGDGTQARGLYGSDTIRLGSPTGPRIRSANLALVNETNSPEAVCGIGLPSMESMAHNIDVFGRVWPTYPNLPMQMKEQGLIKHVCYSLWLNGKGEQGSLLFGGVDKAKYSGELLRVPLIPPPNLPFAIDFSVLLGGIYFQNFNASTTTSCNLRVLLDSGTTNNVLPDRLLAPMMRSIGATYYPAQMMYGVSRAQAEQLVNTNLSFDISGVKITTCLESLLVPVVQQGSLASDLLMKLGMSRSVDRYLFPFTVLPDNSTNSLILGTAFLRSAYVVYDLENKEVAMAQAVLNASTTDVHTLDEKGVKRLKKAPDFDYTKPGSAVNSITTNSSTASPVKPDPLVDKTKDRKSKKNGAPRMSACLWLLALLTL